MREVELRLQRCYHAMFEEVLHLRTRVEKLEAAMAAAGLDVAPQHRRRVARDDGATAGQRGQRVVSGPWKPRRRSAATK